MSCPLCRVPKTDEHINGGWHKFNENLFNQGKMPISEDNYTRFEKPKEENDGKAVTASANPDAGNHNVNKWHWEESDYSTYARKRMGKLFKALEVPHGEHAIKITSAVFNGDAFINQRKGKVFAGFEFRVDLKYEVTIDEVKYTGSAILPDVSADDDDIVITSVKTDGGDSSVRTQINSAFKKGGVKLLTDAVRTFRDELNNIAKDPSSFDPHTLDDEVEDLSTDAKDSDSDSD